MKRFTVIFIFLLPIVSFAQKIMIDNKEKDRELEWKDFKGKPNKEVSYKALTYYDINYQYDNVSFEGNTVHFNYTLTVSFNPKKSWVKDGFEKEELLKHEQVHFDIGILCGREIAMRMKQELFLKGDYKFKINNIFREVMAKYAAMQIQYDTETNHSIIKDEQQKWNAKVDKEISASL